MTTTALHFLCGQCHDAHPASPAGLTDLVTHIDRAHDRSPTRHERTPRAAADVWPVADVEQRKTWPILRDIAAGRVALVVPAAVRTEVTAALVILDGLES